MKKFVSHAPTLMIGMVLGALLASLGSPRDSRWHDTFERDGMSIGVLGGLEYLINDKEQPLSCGFHEISKAEEGYVAVLGAADYVLNQKGWIVRSQSDAYPTDPNGVQCMFVLFD